MALPFFKMFLSGNSLPPDVTLEPSFQKITKIFKIFEPFE